MDGSNHSKETARLIRQARSGSVTGMRHLNRSIGDFRDGMAPILYSLNRVLDAIAKMESFSSPSSDRENLPLDTLAKMAEEITPTRDRLASDYQRFLDGESTEFSQKELRQALGRIRRTTATLDGVRIRHLASPAERMVFKWKRGAVYVLWILLVSGLIAGFSIALTHPGYDEGLNAYYHNKVDFKGHRFECIDHSVDNDWGLGTPFRGLPRNRFSIRWEGCVRVDEGTERQIVAGADDRIQVVLNGEMIINDWSPHKYRLQYAERVLEPGVYPIEIKYQEDKGPARVFLGWKGLQEDVSPIPPENLLPRNVLIGGGGSNRDCPKMPPLRNAKASGKAASR